MEGWSLGATPRALTALRSVDQIAAMTILSELGDIARFTRPPHLMSFVGPTKARNAHVRRRLPVRRRLVECAWGYRFPARKTATIQRRAEKSSAAAARKLLGFIWAIAREVGREQALATAV